MKYESILFKSTELKTILRPFNSINSANKDLNQQFIHPSLISHSIHMDFPFKPQLQKLNTQFLNQPM